MAKEKTKEICGIVMPISLIDGCDESHWVDVQQIIRDAIESVEMEARLVSDADDVGVIQRRIVQNLYDDPIVVCDVSCKNPNVMFELGMRLAFDKPTIIIKDDKTSYSFDTSPIEHIEYPRDLRFATIVDFKMKLSNKIASTLQKSKNTDDYTSFLGHFGTFKVATLDEKEGSINDVLIDEFRELRNFVLSAVKPSRSVAENYKGLPLGTSVRLMMNDLDIKSFEEYEGLKQRVYSRIASRNRDLFDSFKSKASYEAAVDKTALRYLALP